MAWLDLGAEIAELFGELAEAPAIRPRSRPRAVTHLRTPTPFRPGSRRGRVLAAVAQGAHTPREIAAVAGAHVDDVRHDLRNLRREGRIRRGAKGWIL